MASILRQRKPDFSYDYGEYLKIRPMRPINRPAGSLGRSQACNLAMRLWGDRKVTDEVLRVWLDRLFARNLWLDAGPQDGPSRTNRGSRWPATSSTTATIMRPCASSSCRRPSAALPRPTGPRPAARAGQGRLVVGLPALRLPPAVRHGLRADVAGPLPATVDSSLRTFAFIRSAEASAFPPLWPLTSPGRQMTIAAACPRYRDNAGWTVPAILFSREITVRRIILTTGMTAMFLASCRRGLGRGAQPQDRPRHHSGSGAITKAPQQPVGPAPQLAHHAGSTRPVRWACTNLIMVRYNGKPAPPYERLRGQVPRHEARSCGRSPASAASPRTKTATRSSPWPPRRPTSPACSWTTSSISARPRTFTAARCPPRFRSTTCGNSASD